MLERAAYCRFRVSSSDCTHGMHGSAPRRFPRSLLTFRLCDRLSCVVCSSALSRPSAVLLFGWQGSVAVLYAAHLFACFWMFTSTWLQPSHVGAPSWIAADQECAPWAYITPGTVYLRATYFALSVLSSLGYGDMRPQTAMETGVMLFEVPSFLSAKVSRLS